MATKREAVVDEVAEGADNVADLELLNGSEEEEQEDQEGAVDTGNGKAKRPWNHLYGTDETLMTRDLVGNTIRIKLIATSPKATVGKVVFTVLVRETGTKVFAVLTDATLFDLGLHGGPYSEGLSEAQSDAQNRIADRDFLLGLLHAKFVHEDKPARGKTSRPDVFDLDPETMATA